MKQYNTDDYRTLKSSNVMKSIADMPNLRFDSAEQASIFFARELDQVKAKTYVKSKTKKASLNVSGSKAEMKQYVHQLVLSYGWSEYDWQCLVKIINHESGWNPNAVNKSSGACGLFQSLPCSKMKSAGADYRTNYKTQVKWGLGYIKGRYGTPAKAWNFWQKHHWY